MASINYNITPNLAQQAATANQAAKNNQETTKPGFDQFDLPQKTLAAASFSESKIELNSFKPSTFNPDTLLSHLRQALENLA